MQDNLEQVVSLILPKDTLKWFHVGNSKLTDEEFSITLEEKNLPPISIEELNNKKIISKGFKNITITDFPIRGRRTLLTFRRRYWQIQGEKKLLKRDIKLSFPGTQLEQEFADFLKEDGGQTSGLTKFYRQVSASLNQRI